MAAVAATDSRTRPSDRTPADLVIVGAGPAALTAALYAARAGLAVAVYERAAIGGALTEISHLANFPGFAGAGPDLAALMRDQAARAGAHLAYGACTAIGYTASPTETQSAFSLTIDDTVIPARSVLVATGSEPRELPAEVTDALTSPVSYCALCDGDLVKGKRVAVVGGANSAIQEAAYLASLAEDVTVISHSAIKADAAIQQRAAALPNLTIRENLEPSAPLLNEFDHVFVFIGKRPATTFLAQLARESQGLLDATGYILTDTPSHQTVVPGLFAAGDVRAGAVRQAITAAGDGAAAAVEVTNFLQNSQN